MHTRQLTVVEGRHERRAFHREVGLGPVSWLSIFCGAVAAYGFVILALSVAGSIAAGTDSSADFTNITWTRLSDDRGIIVGLIILAAYLVGGYVAGRMARRAALLHGVGVAIAGLGLALGVGELLRWAGGSGAYNDTLRNIGAPTTWQEWQHAGQVAGLAAIAGTAVGAIVGALSGEHWHTRVATRALDPGIGARRRAAADSPAEAVAPLTPVPTAGRNGRTVTDPVAAPVTEPEADPVVEPVRGGRAATAVPARDVATASSPADAVDATDAAVDPVAEDRHGRGWRHLLHH